MKVFECNFGEGVSCRAEVCDNPPPKGTAHIQKVEWTRRPTLKTLRAYIGWMNSVNKTLSDEWGFNLMHIYEVGPGQVEVWTYKPGMPPKKIKMP